MRLILFFFALATTFSLFVAADDIVQCAEYSDPVEGDGVFWSEEVLKLDQLPPLKTLNPYQEDYLQGKVSIKHSRTFWAGGDFTQHYQFNAVFNRGKGNSTITSQLLSKKGAGQQFKINLKKSDGTFIRGFWLNTNSACNNGALDWNADGVNQISVQFRKNMKEKESFF